MIAGTYFTKREIKKKTNFVQKLAKFILETLSYSGGLGTYNVPPQVWHQSFCVLVGKQIIVE